MIHRKSSQARLLFWVLHGESNTRHRPERQCNACANRRKQCSPNETKSYSNPTPPRKRQNNPTNGHTPRLFWVYLRKSERVKPQHGTEKGVNTQRKCPQPASLILLASPQRCSMLTAQNITVVEQYNMAGAVVSTVSGSEVDSR